MNFYILRENPMKQIIKLNSITTNEFRYPDKEIIKNPNAWDAHQLIYDAFSVDGGGGNHPASIQSKACF
jgi:hypothetical protein